VCSGPKAYAKYNAWYQSDLSLPKTSFSLVKRRAGTRG